MFSMNKVIQKHPEMKGFILKNQWIVGKVEERDEEKCFLR